MNEPRPTGDPAAGAASTTPSIHDPIPELEDDDRPIGRVLSRREVLALFGAGAGATLLAACAPGSVGSEAPSASRTAVPTGAASPGSGDPSVGLSPAASPAASPTGTGTMPACVVVPAQTEGPYFVDELLERSDIRVGSPDGAAQAGVPLELAFVVSRVDGSSCLPYAGVVVDVWHCNADGRYSDVTDRSFDTTGEDWLRGYQVADADGRVVFRTIYPGWYQGRTIHIHFKIRPEPGGTRGFDFTSQLYFDDALSDAVMAREPYAARRQRTMRNDGDGIYRDGGDLLLVPLVEAGDGYQGTFAVGIQLE
jgi:protocatechuate 3,4-dioxygenase beta subunit